MERLECNVCYLRYNEADRRPRVLPCGHSFCTPCLTATIQKGSRTCPGCREPINTMSATRLPINFELESLLNLLTEAENSGSVGQDPGVRLSVAPTVGAMSCPEHNLEVAFRCTTHKAWICRRCTVIDHPSGTCKVVSVKEEIKVRKQEQDKTIHAELKNYKEAIVNVETYAKQLEVEEKKHEDIIKKLEAIIKRHREAKDRLVEKRESLKQSLDAAKQRQEALETAQSTLKSAQTPQEVAEACRGAQNEGQNLNDFVKTFEDRNIQITATLASLKVRTVTSWALDHMASTAPLVVDKKFSKDERKREIIHVLKLLCESLARQESCEEILVGWAVHKRDNKKRCAKVTLQDGKLHLHALTTQSPPMSAFKLPYSAVRDVVTTSSALTFLDIAWKGTNHERVYVRLYGDTERGRQFLWLCTAEKGQSYVKTALGVYDKDHPGEYLYGGNYDGKNAPPIGESLGEGGKYLRPRVAGLVAGVRLRGSTDNALFSIYTKGEPSQTSRAGFAKVEKGLDAVEAAATMENVKDLRVVDCGVIVPL